MQLTAKIAFKIHFSEIGSATLWTYRQCWLALVSLEKLWNGRKVSDYLSELLERPVSRQQVWVYPQQGVIEAVTLLAKHCLIR